MSATKSPGIILERIKHHVILIATLLMGKKNFRICKHESFHEAERKGDTNDLFFYFAEIPYAFTLKESSL